MRTEVQSKASAEGPQWQDATYTKSKGIFSPLRLIFGTTYLAISLALKLYRLLNNTVLRVCHCCVYVA